MGGCSLGHLFNLPAEVFDFFVKHCDGDKGAIMTKEFGKNLRHNGCGEQVQSGFDFCGAIVNLGFVKFGGCHPSGCLSINRVFNHLLADGANLSGGSCG